MEGIPELLKNMLLVMGGVNIFYEDDNSKAETQLCRLTCDKLNTFLPALKRELFPVGKYCVLYYSSKELVLRWCLESI